MKATKAAKYGWAWTAAALAATALLPACGSQEPARTETGAEVGQIRATGMPIVDEPLTLRFLSGKSPYNAEFKDMTLWKEYEKRSGIHIEWDLVPSANLAERRNLVLAGGDYPDVFYATGLSTVDVANYGNQGVFIRLNELIEQYAPNLSRLLEQYPSLRKGITMPDGNIYSMPMMFDPEFTSVLAQTKPWFRKDWMDKLNLQLPTSTDELYAFLKAVKEGDPNGNGQADEIPFSTRGIDSLISYLKGSWGIGNRGVKHKWVDVDPDTEELRFIPATAAYKELLQYVNKLFAEDLIDKEIFTMSAEQQVAKLSSGIAGSFLTGNPESFGQGPHYEAAGALVGPHGDKQYALVNPSLVFVAPFAISRTNPHPEASVRWMDYFYSEEGSLLYFMGVEGVTFEFGDDGKPAFVDEINHNPNGLSVAQATGQHLAFPGIAYPGIVRQQFFQGSEAQEIALQATEKLKADMIKEVWPDFTYTVEENDQMLSIGTDIDTYLNEMQAKFITGAASFAEWDTYLATLDKMGLSSYMGIYNAAYDRYRN